MLHQLVLQLPSSALADYDEMIALEEAIEELLENVNDDSNIDGHDAGSNEMNIFIHGKNAESTFSKLHSLLEAHQKHLKAAYRIFYSRDDVSDWIILYPPGLSKFSVL